MKTARLQPTLFSYIMDEIRLWNDEIIGFIESVKKNVTSAQLYLKNSANVSEQQYRIAVDKDHLDKDCRFCTGITWTHDTIDSAYSTFKKIFPNCVIVKVSES